ncbi:MAG: type III pantothenate kinase [Kiritimatiellae bacterium]|nr:type III pantothenate kinase [Kiritimatiellia bacterium]
MAVLVIDVGNSSTTLARYQAGRVSRVVAVKGGIRAAPEACRVALRQAAAGKPPAGVMLASVVPAVNAAWQRLARRETGLMPTVLRHDLRLPVRLDYLHPETTGADRLANVAAAVVRYGVPAMVVDIGTAVTYDLISSDRRFFTGAIGPGPEILARALHDYTAQLPLLEWWRRRPPRVPKDTDGAMSYGIEASFCGTLRETVIRLLPLLGKGARLIATGGFARRFVPPLGMDFVIDPNLTLFGLGWLHDYQTEQ